MLKIVFVSFYNLNSGGGINEWLVEVGNRLSKRNDIDILTSTRGPEMLEARSRLNGPNLVEAPLLRGPRGSGFVGASVKLFSEADVTYGFVQDPSVWLYEATLASFCRTRFVAGWHNHLGTQTFYQKYPIYNGVWRQSSQRNSLFLKKQFSRQSSELVKQFRRIVASAAQRLTYGNHALNSGSLEALRAQETKRVVKVPYGIDSQAYRVSDKQERFTATFLGRLTYQKGIDLLPRLVSKLAGKAPDIRLQIAGYGELSGLVSNLANANPELEYVGPVSGQKKRWFLSGSHVYFSLSRGEAFMLTGLEAMASGTPVITFDIDGPREYVKDGYNGYLCGSLDDLPKGYCLFGKCGSMVMRPTGKSAKTQDRPRKLSTGPASYLSLKECFTISLTPTPQTTSTGVPSPQRRFLERKVIVEQGYNNTQ